MRFWGITLTLNYTDGTKDYYNLPLSVYVTDWQYAAMAVTPKPDNLAKTIDSATLRLEYRNNANTAWFDSISFIEEPVQTYTYDSDGRIIRETYGNVKVDYFYDNDGSPLKIEVNDNGTAYTGYYVLNQQGDVIGIIDAQSNVLVRYYYNAWGLEVDGHTGSRSAQHPLGQYNALKYSGYYYDADFGLYYLNRRYYHPVICKFM